MSSDYEQNIVESAIEAFKERPLKIDLKDGSEIVVHPREHSVHQYYPVVPSLGVVQELIQLHDADSFCAYVNRFKGPQTQIFAEPSFMARSKAASVNAVLDYHKPDGQSGGMTDHCQHNAMFQPRFSAQWQAWSEACREDMGQAEFAEFVEENRADIRQPESAELLDIVRAFKANRKIDFDSVVYQPNGDVKLSYEDRTEQVGESGPLPERITLGIPVYYRGTLYEVGVWVRYKVGSGKVKFGLKLDRADLVEETAFSEITAEVAEKTQLTPYLGRR